MMRRATVIASFLLGSLTLALVGGYLIWLAFREGDCDGGCNSGQLLWSLPAIFLCSNVAAWLMWRRSRRTGISLAGIAATLAALTLVPAVAAYAYQLQRKNSALERQAAVRANQDYSHMLLVVRDIPSSGLSAGTRCVFSTVECEQPPPRAIEALCGHQGVVSITEPNWSGLVRLPREDLPGMAASPEVSNFPKSCGAAAAH